ncbi:hypothetical protein B0T10DRAFT_45609 [Thelonectria olida]|uniref:Uncharacterized protein n=1 Tax=Thelonectria olida TaxID=1576542 RepID=A0A9P9AQT1_9HYPO|nr:hypothetical protein B0T10DRAFT_45609 [Thelonectria olida]
MPVPQRLPSTTARMVRRQGQGLAWAWNRLVVLFTGMPPTWANAHARRRLRHGAASRRPLPAHHSWSTTSGSRATAATTASSEHVEMMMQPTQEQGRQLANHGRKMVINCPTWNTSRRPAHLLRRCRPSAR